MLVIVHSCIENLDRLEACARTWADADTVFVLANPDLDDETELEGDVLMVRTVESYEMLPMKTYLATKWAYEQGREHFLKCDDDTYVHQHNLNQLAVTAEYTGFDVGPWGYTDCPSYASGGGGYILGRQAMACIVDNISRFIQPGAEDHVVGQLLLDNSIFLEHNSRFIPSVQAAYTITDEVTVHLHRQKAEVMLRHHELNQL